MGVQEISLHENREEIQPLTICLHSFADLTHVPPVVFLYLLKECYTHGTFKATAKFRVLQQQVSLVLFNSPQPGPATFVLHCLCVLPIFGLYCEGFSHLVISALHRFQRRATTTEDTSSSKVLAAELFLNTIRGVVNHDERIVVKLLQVFDVKLADIDEAMGRLGSKTDDMFGTAKAFVEDYIFKMAESQLYMAAVNLLEHFSIRQSGETFLLKMMQNKQSAAAEKWATFIGKPMLCVLVKEYVNRNMLKRAYDTIKKNNLREEFPEVYRKCKESLLKKLAEKALWDLAETKANGDQQFLEYLVYLAMEAGYTEKVDELCDRYSLEGFVKAQEANAHLLHNTYLQLSDLVAEGIVWVDDIHALSHAKCHFEECKVVGVDCEWKPNYIKGAQPSKVSIMQIATDKMVFIFDLIKLCEDIPDTLDDCLSRIFQSPRILKLGYNFGCDMKQLAHSYGQLKCFVHYDMMLDIQSLFKEPRGGLSRLSEKILGVGLNKTRRNSNWEQRPLSQNQLEYAALDAVVLVHIFHRVRDHPQPGQDKIQWKSHIVSHMDNAKKKKEPKRRTKLKDENEV